MTILKVMFAVAIGTYIAYELTIRNKNLLSGSRNKQIETAPNDKPAFDL